MQKIGALVVVGLLVLPPGRSVLAQTITVDPSVCRSLVRAVPEAGVRYQPGVDVHGRPVPGADVAGRERMVPPDRFVIPVTIDLARRLGLPPDVEQKAYVAIVTSDRGQLAVNGRPLGNDLDREFAQICRDQAERTGRMDRPGPHP